MTEVGYSGSVYQGIRGTSTTHAKTVISTTRHFDSRSNSGKLLHLIFISGRISCPIAYPVSLSIYILTSYSIVHRISFPLSCMISYRLEWFRPWVAGTTTRSEAILTEFASKHSLNASTIQVKEVLKIHAFNANEVDTDMLQRLRLQASIDSSDVQIINMHAKGGGEQVLEWYRYPAEKLLYELMADIGLAGSHRLSTLHFTSTRTSVAAYFLQGAPTVQYHID
jgi:hypothetical protein